ncbi:MAG TPA: DUF6089 family protein [Bacteroidales bacterium]|nr:DUF6089 family protein [Bacteroidales bacterium]HPS17989.1 DUF6089 family protein [Bacteroidales bacterium]
MKKIIIILFCTYSFALNVSAQRNEIGILLGTTYYLGDLNPYKHFLLSKPAGGIIYRYIFNPRWALKIDGLYGNVEGDDAVAKFNEQRNLSFKSHIFEISPQLELNFLPYITGNKEKNYFTPYIFGGIAIFSFNPKAEYNGTWYDLKPLGTEGQGTSQYSSVRKPYSLTNISFPFGLGFKYSIGKKVSVGLEWGLRKTITDYIDDVSTTYADPAILSAENGVVAAALADKTGDSDNTGLQRGNSVTKDWYSFVGGFITFKFKTGGDIPCPGVSSKHHKFRDFLRKD